MTGKIKNLLPSTILTATIIVSSFILGIEQSYALKTSEGIRVVVTYPQNDGAGHLAGEVVNSPTGVPIKYEVKNGGAVVCSETQNVPVINGISYYYLGSQFVTSAGASGCNLIGLLMNFDYTISVTADLNSNSTFGDASDYQTSFVWTTPIFEINGSNYGILTKSAGSALSVNGGIVAGSTMVGNSVGDGVIQAQDHFTEGFSALSSKYVSLGLSGKNGASCSNGQVLAFTGGVWGCVSGSEISVSSSFTNQPRYYDADNLAYYADPNGTSVLSNATFSSANAGSGLVIGSGSAPSTEQDVLVVKGDWGDAGTFSTRRGGITIAGNAPTLRFRKNNSSTPNMIFHRNDWFFGGVGGIIIASEESNGNMNWGEAPGISSVGDLYARKLYDTNNYSYYIDPNGSSVVNEVTYGNGTIISYSAGGGTNYMRGNTYFNGTIFDESNVAYYVKPSSSSNFYNIKENGTDLSSKYVALGLGGKNGQTCTDGQVLTMSGTTWACKTPGALTVLSTSTYNSCYNSTYTEIPVTPPSGYKGALVVINGYNNMYSSQGVSISQYMPKEVILFDNPSQWIGQRVNTNPSWGHYVQLYIATGSATKIILGGVDGNTNRNCMNGSIIWYG